MLLGEDPTSGGKGMPDTDTHSFVATTAARCRSRLCHLCLEPLELSMSVGARSKLLDAAISTIREKGYAGTSVDELCSRAGVTKGAFFHHFPTKDSLGVAAANHWSELSVTLFAAAPYQRSKDPLDRVLGYLDFRKALLRGEVAEFTCLAGTMVQEAYGTHPDIRRACDASITGHAVQVESDIAAACNSILVSVLFDSITSGITRESIDSR
jgi:AcrR family transcriptional regulator